ncbi:MAG: Pr6Pr family membrane protein [Oscillospiraceae bacterium]|nr:Pr6Pr family membrane protein [Oscillospiraceae bacterium]
MNIKLRLKENKWLALAFRLSALIIISIGFLGELGVFRNTVDFDMFKYYTIQSNLLAVIMFAILAVRTVIGLIEKSHCSAVWFTRLRMVCSVNLLLTFIVFWTLLAPNLPTFYLLSFANLLIHVIAPLLCLADYILFYEAGRLKYKDVYFTCIFPLFYFVFVTVLGYVGYNYGNRVVITKWLTAESVEMHTVPRRAPYFFLDFDEVGAMVLVYIGMIIAVILVAGHIFYLIDRKLRKNSI